MTAVETLEDVIHHMGVAAEMLSLAGKEARALVVREDAQRLSLIANLLVDAKKLAEKMHDIRVVQLLERHMEAVPLMRPLRRLSLLSRPLRPPRPQSRLRPKL